MIGIIKTEICCEQPGARLSSEKDHPLRGLKMFEINSHMDVRVISGSSYLKHYFFSRLCLWNHIQNWYCDIFWSKRQQDVTIVPGETSELWSLLTELQQWPNWLVYLNQTAVEWCKEAMFLLFISKQLFCQQEDAFDK